MPRTMIYPAHAEIRVPKPGGGFLRPEGERVITDGAAGRWWRRRIADGDATTELPAHLVTAKAEDEPPKPKRKRAPKKTPDPAEEATE